MHKIAVVGCGMMANAWIENAVKRENCDIVALVDVDEKAAQGRKEAHKLDASIYTDLSVALEREDINLVFDVTPPEYHYTTVTRALEAGCNVFGEKPMSDSLDDAKKMVACAEKTGNEYFVMQNRRYISNIHTLKTFLESDKLGDVGQLSANFQVNPHFGGFREDMDSPLIADMAIHTFDAARYILGKNPVSVYCHEFNPTWSWYKGNANAVCIFQMEDGTVFDYRGSWCANGLNTSWESEWRVSCEKGSVHWDGAEKLYYDIEESESSKTGISDSEVIDSSIQDIDRIVMEKEAHVGCIEDMFQALEKGTRPQTDCRDNIKSITMVHKAIESARTNKVVTL